MRTIGPGVAEIRIHDEGGAFRVIYIATRDSAIYVLHAFQKKTSGPRNAIWTSRRRGLDRFSRQGRTTMERQDFANVWDALENTQAEAASMTMRSNVIIAIEQTVRGWNVTQTEAARRLGVTQPRLNDLLRGRVQNFSLDALVDLAARAGLSVRLDIAA